MPHASVSGLINWRIDHDAGHRKTTQFAPLYFDVAFQELMSTPGSGGELVMVPEETRHDPRLLLALVETADIDRMFLPTAALAPFCRAATSRHQHIRRSSASASAVNLAHVITSPAVQSTIGRSQVRHEIDIDATHKSVDRQVALDHDRSRWKATCSGRSGTTCVPTG
jgi:non-ribosomal peptide synthetase component F